MTPSTRSIRRSLLAWYRRNARDLPWRRTCDPYRIWLSEIMLQQTRVETVRPYYARFVRALPHVRKLAAASEDVVLKLWEGLGYYSRARNLRRTARIIANEHHGRWPRSARELADLPGIGRYTAGAIASIAFDERVPVLDGNVKRVLSRVYGVESSIDQSATIRELWMMAEGLVPRAAPGDFNQALMELGARVCTPKNPRCAVCPIGRQCCARAGRLQDRLPVRRARKAVPHYDIVAGAIRRNGRYLIGRRPPSGLLGGLWEFPGGQVRPGECHEEALIREVREQAGLAIAVREHLASIDHAYSHFAITLHLYRGDAAEGRLRGRYHTELKWVPRTHFGRYAFPAAHSKCLPRV